MALFSIRYKKALADKSLELKLPQRLRNSMLRTCEQYDPLEDPHDNWSSYKHSPKAQELCLRETGANQLVAYSENKQGWVEADFREVFARGPRAMVMDLVEAFLMVLPDDEAHKCERELDEYIGSHDSEWRIAGGCFFKIDSAFLAEEIDARAHRLLDRAGFEGPLHEFAEARAALSAGDGRNAVIMANNAFESTMKCLLGKETGKPGELIRWTIDERLVPEYYEGFLKAFEKILHAVTSGRSQPGVAHGQGPDVIEVPTPFAEFVIHLTGTLIVFLVRQKVEFAGDTETKSEEPDPEDEFGPIPEGEDIFGDQ